MSKAAESLRRIYLHYFCWSFLAQWYTHCHISEAIIMTHF